MNKDEIERHNGRIDEFINQLNNVRWEDTRQGMPIYKRLWRWICSKFS